MSNPYQSPSTNMDNVTDRPQPQVKHKTYVALLLLLSCFLAVAYGLSAYIGLNYQVRYPERVPQSISTIRDVIASLLSAAAIVLVLSQRPILAWKLFAGSVVFAVGSAIVIIVINMISDGG